MGFPILPGLQRHGRLPKFALPAANGVDFFHARYRNVAEDSELNKVATNRKRNAAQISLIRKELKCATRLPNRS